MSTFKNKNSIAEAQFKHFEGIDRAKPIGDLSSAYDMENFRVMPDTSLEKRCGFAPLCKFNGKIRGIWSGNVGADTVTFVIHGNTVSVRSQNDSSFWEMGTLSTSEGFADFIFYDSRLYINDGAEFFWVTKDKLTPVNAYIPLIGVNWRSGVVGSEYEPLNYLTGRFRITYYVDKPVIYLCTKYAIKSIDAVYVNGLMRLGDTYFYDEQFGTLCVLDLEVGDSVQAFFTVADYVFDVKKVLSYRRHAIYGTNDNNRLFLFGGANDNMILGTKKVDPVRVEDYSWLYPDTLPIYMPRSNEMTLGQEAQRITDVCRHHDRLLIFTDTDTWMISNPAEYGETLDATIINSHNGCTSPNGSILCMNDPICVSNGTILRWIRNTEELDESSAESISRKIDSLLDDSFFHNAVPFLNRKNSEIFFFEPSSEAGIIWVYNFISGNWYKFSGICAEAFFEYNGKVGFYNGDTLYIFDEAFKHDQISDEAAPREIVAYYESQPLDFEASPYKKKIFAITLDADFDKGSIIAECICEDEAICKTVLSAPNEFITGTSKRLTSPRFSHTKLRLTAKGEARQRIHKATLFAKV